MNYPLTLNLPVINNFSVPLLTFYVMVVLWLRCKCSIAMCDKLIFKAIRSDHDNIEERASDENTVRISLYYIIFIVRT